MASCCHVLLRLGATKAPVAAMCHLHAVLKVLKLSANDFEAWSGNNWVACGSGATDWYDGYLSEMNKPNVNFVPNIYIGENANFVNSSQWRDTEVYTLAYGKGGARVYPQIYCPGQPVTWVDFRRRFFLQFDGVTSENGYSKICNAQRTLRTYYWNEAWNAFNDALRFAPSTFPPSNPFPAPYENNLNGSVSSFYYPAIPTPTP